MNGQRTTEIVVAAMIPDEEGRVLVAERPEGKFMAGWWEFPGGKVEFGESPEAALAREVREELGIEIEVGDPFHVVNVVRGPDRAVLVMFYWCRWISGEIELLDAGAVDWATAEDLDRIRFLESNRPVVEKLKRREARGARRESE
jgi:8-oxo-dGTP diphosphatase